MKKIIEFEGYLANNYRCGNTDCKKVKLMQSRIQRERYVCPECNEVYDIDDEGLKWIKEPFIIKPRKRRETLI